MRFTAAALLLGFVCAAGATLASAQIRLPLDAPRPIDAADSLWAEELTSMEIRDALRAGTTTIIIGTGGVEQNGPYVVGGKHNYVLQTVLPPVARAIGHALIAPIVKFVPEGEIEPTASGHMAYSGTIGVEAATFEALLTDICRSYKAHGFIDIVLLGDSGGNQTGMENVAAALNRKWAGERARVHYLREYYFEDQWSYNFLKSLGVTQIDRTPPPGAPQDRAADWRNGIHDDIYYEAQIAVQDPKLIRMDQRVKAGLFSLHGVELAPIGRTIEIGQKLADYRAGITAKAFEASQRRLRGPAQAAAFAPTSSPGRDSVQQKVVLSYFHDVLDGRKIGLLDELFGPDCVIYRPEGTVKGMAGIRGVVERNIAAYSTFETDVHDIFESGDRVVVRITHRAMGAGEFRSRLGVYNVKGKPVTWEAIAIFRLQNGKIAEEWVNRDELGILLSFGGVKP